MACTPSPGPRAARPKAGERPVPTPSPLTAREHEVLTLLARGCTDKEAARRLGVSDLTVRKHRENLLRKTATHKVAALVTLAVRQGWLPG